ncbi:hypothetical protein BpHYR1_041459 [Brachionus plicatilis]|uniref:Uncharacterized protein n=1 Tax=Brachionus plicatilis TaxID=10195 RepID=A0A3M7SX02_BRAPC|nr:hypothetical protein BpHYR1_041459 [Brachionus plicatilis]
MSQSTILTGTHAKLPGKRTLLHKQNGLDLEFATQFSSQININQSIQIRLRQIQINRFNKLELTTK